jgi:flagellar hook-basal body protein
MKRPRISQAGRALRIEQLEQRQLLSLQSALTTLLASIGASDWPDMQPMPAVPSGPSLDPLFCGSEEPRVTIDAPFRVGIHGDGFFIVEGPNSELLYTRNDDYRLNEEYQLVTNNNMRVLGYGVRSGFELDRGELVRLTVPLGMVASAVTTRATFVGNLSPEDSRLGETSYSDFVVFDEFGVPVRIALKLQLSSTSGGVTTYTWQASLADNRNRHVEIDPARSSGEIEFDNSGKIAVGGTNQIAFKNPTGSGAAWEIQLYFDQLTALASQLGRYGPIELSGQDGYPVGTLRDYSITERGEIKGLFDTGMSRTLGRIQLASFPNPHGLMERANGYYAAAAPAGERSNNDPGVNHFGSVVHFPAGVDLHISGPPASPSYPWDLRTAHLAVAGNGFLALQDAAGQRFYARNGEFHLNAQHQLITRQGLQLLGFDADAVFHLNAERMAPIDVPIGMTAASATRNVTIVGHLSPRAEPATVAGILESEGLGDGSVPSPDASKFESISFSILTNANSTSLNVGGTYAFRLTFFDTETGLESRPTSPIGWIPITDPDRQIRLDNIPHPDAEQFNAVRIYRNTEHFPDSYYLLATLQHGEATYLDDRSDGAILNNPPLDLIGPRVSPHTRLVDVVHWNGTAYEKPFVYGELSFCGERGGLALAESKLLIDETTTIAELLQLMAHAFGIDRSVTGPTSEIPGGTVVDGQLRFVSNAGDVNVLEIPNSAFEMRPASSSIAQRLRLQFLSAQQPDGHGTLTQFVVFDSAGAAIEIRLATVLEAKGDWGATYRWFAYLADKGPQMWGLSAAIGNGTITFGPDGKVIAGQTAEIAMNDWSNVGASTLMSLDFRQVSGLSLSDWSERAGTLQLGHQDGYPPGVLERFDVGETGLVMGRFDNGMGRPLGQIMLATFRNPGQLRHIGDGLYVETRASGSPRIGQPGGALGTLTVQRPDATDNERPMFRPPSRHFQTPNWRAARRGQFAPGATLPASSGPLAASVIDATWAKTEETDEMLSAVLPEASTEAAANSIGGLSLRSVRPLVNFAYFRAM